MGRYSFREREARVAREVREIQCLCSLKAPQCWEFRIKGWPQDHCLALSGRQKWLLRSRYRHYNYRDGRKDARHAYKRMIKDDRQHGRRHQPYVRRMADVFVARYKRNGWTLPWWLG